MHCEEVSETSQRAWMLISPNMIRQTSQEIFPITRLPESEAFHVSVIVAHRCVAVRCPMQVKVDKLFQVSPYDLIGVHEDDLLEIHGEQNVEEQYFIGPYDALLLFLRTKPRWPFVGNKLVLEAVGFS